MRVDEVSVPEPDFSIIPGGDPRRWTETPHAAVLVIEVSNSSLRFDLGEKARRYAMAGYPDYWAFDVMNNVVHVHRGPNDDGSWASVEQLTQGSLTAMAAPQISLQVEEFCS